MPRADNLAQDQANAQQLLQSSKDRAENIMIVDLLRNDLGHCCEPGSIKVAQLCQLQSFRNVHHLVSTITGQLADEFHSLDLLKAAFPGGSITGAPKIRAMQIIEQLEPHQRSAFCGSIFYVDANGNCDSNIAIRTTLCDNNRIHCYAGGGIVYDSNCEAEYAESLVKIQRVMDVFNMIKSPA